MCCPPKTMWGKLHLPVMGMDLLMSGPIMKLLILNCLVGMKKANFAHKIDPLSMENRCA